MSRHCLMCNSILDDYENKVCFSCIKEDNHKAKEVILFGEED